MRTIRFTTYATTALSPVRLRRLQRNWGGADLAIDTDAEPQPVVSGYIEFAGEIVKISSVEDIERGIGEVKRVIETKHPRT